MGLFKLGKKDKTMNDKSNESSMEKNVNLTPPKIEKSTPILPLPGENLNEIKTQVTKDSNTSESNFPSNLQNNVNSVNTSNENLSNLEKVNSTSDKTTTEDVDEILNDDSLFDFSEMDFNNSTKSEETPNREEEHLENTDTVSNTLKELPNLNIDKKSKLSDKPFFITTKQFKTLLELIEYIKKKVKDSNETHLRLLDIMSEEDIEYDNLRKDFEFIENKLYEIDELLFTND